MPNYYDRQGNPIRMDSWVLKFGDTDYKTVAKDTVGSYTVSTVWLGLDHNFVSNDDPIIFETMVFNAKGEDVYQKRYSTEQDARNGHAKIVGKYEV